MTLTIERLKVGQGNKDIKITRVHDEVPIEYTYMDLTTLKDLVFWSTWFGENANSGMGCNLKPGEKTHVG